MGQGTLVCPRQLGYLDTTPRHQLNRSHATSALSDLSSGSHTGKRLSSSCLAGTQAEEEPGSASLVFRVSPANVIEVCPFVQPFSWVSCRQGPQVAFKGRRWVCQLLLSTQSEQLGLLLGSSGRSLHPDPLQWSLTQGNTPDFFTSPGRC